MGAVGWVNSVELAQAMAAGDDHTMPLQVDVPARDFLIHRDTVEGRLGQVDALLRPLGYTVKKVSVGGGLTEQFLWEPPPHTAHITFTHRDWNKIDLRLLDMPWARGFCERVMREKIDKAAGLWPVRVMAALAEPGKADEVVTVNRADLQMLYDRWMRLEYDYGEQVRNEVVKGVSEGS
jgi:hypothetical protein